MHSTPKRARIKYKYVPAELKHNRRWYVEYSYQRSDGQMQRVRTGIGWAVKRLRTMAEKKAFGINYAAQINQKLSEGWTPEVDQQVAVNGLAGTSWADIGTRYLAFLAQSEKSGSLRHETANSYKSFFGILNIWNDGLPVPMKAIWQFNGERCNQWMAWAVAVRGVSETTRKSYRAWLSTFCSWLIDVGYLKDSPMKDVKGNGKKRRTVERERLRSYYISTSDRKRIFEWFKQNSKPMLLCCYLVHYCLLRPREIAQLQVRHVELKNSMIYVPGFIAKNRTDAHITMPDVVAKLMLDLHFLEQPMDYYLFDCRTLTPGTHKGRGDQFRGMWALMREQLQLPDTVKLYNLKHTGITDMAEAMPERLVQKQARHHSIEMTERYIQEKAPEASQAIKKYK